VSRNFDLHTVMSLEKSRKMFAAEIV
jgi:hypothetical protein